MNPGVWWLNESQRKIPELDGLLPKCKFFWLANLISRQMRREHNHSFGVFEKCLKFLISLDDDDDRPAGSNFPKRRELSLWCDSSPFQRYGQKNSNMVAAEKSSCFLRKPRKYSRFSKMRFAIKHPSCGGPIFARVRPLKKV